MSFAIEYVDRLCHFCGRISKHILQIEQRVFRETLVVNRTYTCMRCGGKDRI